MPTAGGVCDSAVNSAPSCIMHRIIKISLSLTRAMNDSSSTDFQ